MAVIYEDDRKLREEPIPDPPALHVVSSDEQEDGVVLQWAPEEPEEGPRDWSGNWDDQYDGTINFAVVAE
jgi:hypothetical protein